MPQTTLTAKDLDDPTFEKLLDAHTSIAGASHVDVRVDHVNRVLDVNVNGILVLHICDIGNFEVGIDNVDQTTSTVLK